MIQRQNIKRAVASLCLLATTTCRSEASSAASSPPPLGLRAAPGVGGPFFDALVVPGNRSRRRAQAGPLSSSLISTRRRRRTSSPFGGAEDDSSPSSFLAEDYDAGIIGDKDSWAPAGDDAWRCADAIVAARRRGPADKAVQMCSVGKNLVRGALLRIASDLTGGTPLESVKCRVTVSTNGPLEACQNIVREGGIANLWSGTPARTVEGALMGAMFLVGSAFTKEQVIKLTGSQTLGALSGGVVGGVLQAIVMTPAGVVFTSLNVNKGKEGYENDNAITVTRRIIREKGVGGMFIGGGAMAARQASNWASRSMFTEIARTNFGLTKYGAWGEIVSGAMGGVGSCWNTPIETVRVFMHRDLARGEKPKKFGEYWNEIKEEGGYPGLFRGVSPRAVQAIWQTVFMVVVPNMLGI